MFPKLVLVRHVWSELSAYWQFRASFRRAYYKVKRQKVQKDWKDNFHADFAPVFFLSTGRCGTDFIRSILLIDKNIDVYHEPMPRLGYASKYAYDNKMKADAMALAILAARFEYISTSYLLDRVYAETNNRMTFFALGIFSLFPQAKFVFVTRHPGAFVRSGIRRGYFEEGGAFLMDGKIALNDDSTMSQIECVARLWNDTNQYIEEFLPVVPTSQVMRLRAEDCFRDVQVLQRLFEFVGGKCWNPAKVEQLMKKPRNTQQSGTFPGYQEWTPEMRNQLAAQALLAEKYGYSLTESGN